MKAVPAASFSCDQESTSSCRALLTASAVVSAAGAATPTAAAALFAAAAAEDGAVELLAVLLGVAFCVSSWSLRAEAGGQNAAVIGVVVKSPNVRYALLWLCQGWTGSCLRHLALAVDCRRTWLQQKL